MSRLSASSIAGLRSAIRPEYAGLPAEDLESLAEASISTLPTATTEDFLSSLSSFGKVAGPALQRAAPDVAQGAVAGSALGPYGAIAGAGVGLVSSLIKSQNKPAAPPPKLVPAPMRSTAPVASSPPPSTAPSTPSVTSAPPPVATTPETSSPPSAPVVSAITALPTGQEAAATVFSLLQNPTVQQALLSQVLGSSGNQQVTTESGTIVPRGAINSLLTQLLANASEALPEAESISEQSYLQDSAGEYLVDPASLDQHAALILSHLQRRSFAQPNTDSADWFAEDFGEMDEGWADGVESIETVSFF